MKGADSARRLPRQRARRLERAARHVLRCYQRTYDDYGLWAQDVDELRLDYVIALEALMISPDDSGEGIARSIRARSAALFAAPDLRERVEEAVGEAYKARSRYVHGDVLTEQDETTALKQLRTLRLIVRGILLRWLVLTPTDHRGLAPLLDAAADGDRKAIDEPLDAFFAASPPQDAMG